MKLENDYDHSLVQGYEQGDKAYFCDFFFSENSIYNYSSWLNAVSQSQKKQYASSCCNMPLPRVVIMGQAFGFCFLIWFYRQKAYIKMLIYYYYYFTGDNVDCWMEIQHGKGPWADPVAGIVPLGTTLTMVVGINDKLGKYPHIFLKYYLNFFIILCKHWV